MQMKTRTTANHGRGSIAALVVTIAVMPLWVTGCRSGDEAKRTPAAAQMYDEETSGTVLVEAALARARAENRQVILLFGANWCPYCRQLHELLNNDPAVGAVVRQSFVVVPIDVGTSARNRNVNLIDRYGATVFSEGVPSVVVIDADGRRLAPTKANPWSSKDRIESARMLNFLGNIRP